MEYYCPHCLRPLWPLDDNPSYHACEEHPDGTPQADLVPKNPEPQPEE